MFLLAANLEIIPRKLISKKPKLNAMHQENTIKFCSLMKCSDEEFVDLIGEYIGSKNVFTLDDFHAFSNAMQNFDAMEYFYLE